MYPSLSLFCRIVLSFVSGGDERLARCCGDLFGRFHPSLPDSAHSVERRARSSSLPPTSATWCI